MWGSSGSDRISGDGHVVCSGCRNCLAGRRHLFPTPAFGNEMGRAL